MQTRMTGMVRRYGSPPWWAAVLHGGPGAPGDVAALARRLGESAGVLEPVQSGLSVDELVVELHEQLSAAAREPLVVIGHSWGAWLALLHAARYPEQVCRLVLVASGPLDAASVGEIARRRRARMTRGENAEYSAALLALDAKAGAAKNAALRRLGELTRAADSYRLLPEEPAAAADALPANAQQYAAVWPEADRLRAEGALATAAGRVRCPVTVLHGEDDPHPAAGVVDPLRIAGLEPEVHIFPRCGHYPFLEEFAADAFYATLRPLLLA